MNKLDMANGAACSRPNRISRAFWTLNNEMNMVNKASFFREIDATALDAVRGKYYTNKGIKPSYTALVVKAVSIALAEYPYANRAILGIPFLEKIVQFNNMDITVAIERNVEDAEAVVLAETLRGVDSKNAVEVTEELREILLADEKDNERWKLFSRILRTFPVFISRWILRSPRFSPKQWVEHRGNACFVNSPAKYGIDFVVADMIWPLTVMFGWVKERPIAVDGKVEVRRTTPLSIIFDRRIMAGAPAAKFFNRLAEILENADSELWEGGNEK